MDSDRNPWQAHSVPNFNLNGTPVNNPYIAPGFMPERHMSPGYYASPELYGEDELAELEPQYQQLPQSQVFLSAEAVDKHYTEIQVGVGSTSGGPLPPLCDNYRSHQQINSRPIVYTCDECIPPEARYLCKKCAQRELADPAALHTPDHGVRKWQPTWTFDLSHGISIPMLTPEMEEFARNDLPDDLRALTFESRKYYDDRAIRFFLPAPQGQCHVVVHFDIEPIENEKREMDIVDKAKGFFKFEGLSEVFGNVGMFGEPFNLSTPPIAPRTSVEKEPTNIPKKGEIGSSKSIDLKRGYNFRKSYTLDVYVNAKGIPEQNGIEIVLQDEYYPSKEFYHHPFRWKVKAFEITCVPKASPPFASRAQLAQFKQRKAEIDREDREKQRQSMMEMYQDSQEYWEKYRGRRAERYEERNQRPVSTPPPSSKTNAAAGATLAQRAGRTGAYIPAAASAARWANDHLNPPSHTNSNSKTQRYRPNHSPPRRSPGNSRSNSPRRSSGNSPSNSPQRGRARFASEGNIHFDMPPPDSRSRQHREKNRLDPMDALGRSSNGTPLPGRSGRSASASPMGARGKTEGLGRSSSSSGKTGASSSKKSTGFGGSSSRSSRRRRK